MQLLNYLKVFVYILFWTLTYLSDLVKQILFKCKAIFRELTNKVTMKKHLVLLMIFFYLLISFVIYKPKQLIVL